MCCLAPGRGSFGSCGLRAGALVDLTCRTSRWCSIWLKCVEFWCQVNALSSLSCSLSLWCYRVAGGGGLRQGGIHMNARAQDFSRMSRSLLFTGLQCWLDRFKFPSDASSMSWGCMGAIVLNISMWHCSYYIPKIEIIFKPWYGLIRTTHFSSFSYFIFHTLILHFSYFFQII